jgi:hypothetical protein
MIRMLTLALALTVALQGVVFGQGILESVFGQGLFDAGGGQFQQPMVQQFNNPQFYSGGGDPNNPYNPQQGQGVPYGTPQQQSQQYYPQGGGIYSDWHRYPAATTGEQPPVSYQSPPPVTYSPPPPQQPAQAPPAQRATRAPRAPSAPSVAAPPGPPPGPVYGAATQPPLRPGQYSPQQPPPPGPGALDPELLPPGATQITTTTPEGTTVQYFAPSPDPSEPMPAVQAPPRRVKPRQTAAPATAKQKTPQAQAQQQGSTGIAMPKPVEMPAGRDPREGWTGR